MSDTGADASADNLGFGTHDNDAEAVQPPDVYELGDEDVEEGES
jgi:hypothetical protein